MLNVSQFIADHITGRQKSMFAADIEANRDKLRAEIEGKRVLVIGGAGTIGSSYIRAVLPFRPSKLVVVDISENGLAELTRDLRSTYGMYVPEEYRTYPLSFADPVFEKIFRAEQGFDIVANFSAHKHVRSEKDKYSVQALLENNVLKARKLLDLLSEFPPRHFFCVSTDKAANPVNISQQEDHGGNDHGLFFAVQNIDGPFCQCGFFERKSAGRIYRPADEASAAEFSERCETLFRFSGGEWTDLYAGLHSGTEPGDLFPETGSRADDDLLLYRRPVPA